MKYFFIILSLLSLLKAQDTITEVAPPEVLESAIVAVENLGKEVVMGRYQIAMERMYPRWKSRIAEKMGGIDKLEDQLDQVAQQMLQQGISITDFTPTGKVKSFEVSTGKKVEIVKGQKVEKLCYTKWLVIVPTITKFRALIKGDPVAVMIESKGFQIAISDKGANEWTFIDGSGITVSDLRSLFGNIPQDLELPPLEKKQLK